MESPGNRVSSLCVGGAKAFWLKLNERFEEKEVRQVGN